jgi:uncharacterized protein (TIGR02453 family)
VKPKVYMDFESYPPFDGFPKEGLRFFKQLKQNNNREWFNAHKAEYEEFVKMPMQSMIASLQPSMARLAPEIEVHPKRNMFRIYRDIRFSKNKLPYKTHMAAVFHRKGHWEESAGYYVHIEPGGVYVGGGVYMPDSQQLKKIRRAIAERADEFLDIVNDRTFKKKFKTLEGEKLLRNPIGFPSDHPMIEWLKYKQFYTGVEWNEKECYTPKLIDKVLVVYKDLLPMIRFLNNALA